MIVVDPAAMDLLGWPIGLHQQLLNRKNVEVDQLKVLFLGLGGSWVGQPAKFPSLWGPLFSIPGQGMGPVPHSAQL